MPRVKTTERIRFDPQTRSDVYHKCECRCAHCGVHLSYHSDFTVEHVIPINKGGTNDMDNLVALCEACNKAKSDDIIQPADYYAYLPKNRLIKVQALFDKYIRSVDFLDKNNLFLLDRFDLETKNVVFVKQCKQLLVPTVSRVEKLRKADAFDWLYEHYVGRLCTGDKSLMANNADAMRDVYKCVSSNGTVLFLFSLYVKKMEWIAQDTESRNTLCADLYFNPEIKIRPHATIPTLYLHFMSIVQIVQRKFGRIAPCTAIECFARAPHSDRIANSVFQFIEDHTSHGVAAKFIEGDERADSYCNGICVVLLNATERKGTALARSKGYRSIRDMVEAEGHDWLVDPLDDALEKIQEQVPDQPKAPPPKQKPRDRKYKTKKKNRKK